MKKKGFTLVELLLVLGIMAVLFGIATILFLPNTNRAELGGEVEKLVATMRDQQIKAMAGKTEGNNVVGGWGVKIEANSYTAFSGNNYGAGTESNVVTTMPAKVSAGSTLPAGTVVFERISGEVVGWSEGNNTITLTEGMESKTITINRLGVIDEQ